MANYYGVVRSGESLTHYGVKGMKWGVRRALRKTGEARNKALARQFKKASKKLEKLNARTDVQLQKEKVDKFNKLAKKSAKIGAAGASLAVAGTGTNHTLHYINSLQKQITKNKLADLDRKSSKEFDDHWGMIIYNDKQYRSGKISEAEWNALDKQVQQSHTDAQNKIGAEANKVIDDFDRGMNKRKLAADIGRYVSYGGAGVGVAGLGTAAIAKGKAIAAKRRTTDRGHVKAVAERDAWKKEMESAFKGTQYDASGSVKKKKKKVNT